MTRTAHVLLIIGIGSMQCGLALDFSDSFDTPHDFIAQDVGGTGWHGLEYGQSALSVGASQAHEGQLLMSASGAISPAIGPFLYHQLNSDSLTQISGFAHMRNK